ncbi:hypothetical protein GOP47_0029517, partial [Adiantum capillus-veneris]
EREREARSAHLRAMLLWRVRAIEGERRESEEGGNKGRGMAPIWPLLPHSTTWPLPALPPATHPRYSSIKTVSILVGFRLSTIFKTDQTYSLCLKLDTTHQNVHL